MNGLGRSFLVGAAIALPLMQPGVPDALLNQTDLSPDLQESAITLVENVSEAAQEGVEGARQGEDAAGAEQVAEAEYSDTSPPPPGSTFESTPEPQSDAVVQSGVSQADLEASTPEPQAEWDEGPGVNAQTAEPGASAVPEPETGAGPEPAPASEARGADPGPDVGDVDEPEPELA